MSNRFLQGFARPVAGIFDGAPRGSGRRGFFRVVAGLPWGFSFSLGRGSAGFLGGFYPAWRAGSRVRHGGGFRPRRMRFHGGCLRILGPSAFPGCAGFSARRVLWFWRVLGSSGAGISLDFPVAWAGGCSGGRRRVSGGFKSATSEPNRALQPTPNGSGLCRSLKAHRVRLGAAELDR